MKANKERNVYSENDCSYTDSSNNHIGSASYFSSYENLDVHRIMLSDRPRTTSYRKAILENRSLFQGKVVMDVGAGTGMLSLFAVEAGATKVYAIEASNVALIARDIVRQNHLESIIDVFSCQVEDFILPNSEKVDVIISEWMGFYLLHESMLSSVIFARDKFLKDSGSMFPCVARIYACPSNLQDFHEKEIQFWDNVYGYNFSVVKQSVLQNKQNSPQIMLVSNTELLSEPELIKCFHLMRCGLEDLRTIQTKHFISSLRKDICRGIVLWFDCEFPSADAEGVVLSTAPDSEPTHWKQTVIVLPVTIELDAGDVIGFSVEFAQSKENYRHYHIKFEILGDDVEHPVPCKCGTARCTLVKAFLEEQDQEEMDETGKIIDITI